MLAFLTPGSPAIYAFLGICLVLVLVFEFSNGFHDTANAVATVIYTHSLKPVLRRGLVRASMNFLGVMLGGIAVAYALVELIPPDALSPPERRDRGRHAGGDLHLGAGLERRHLVARHPELELARPDRRAHRHRGRELACAMAAASANGVDWHQIWSVLRLAAGLAGARLRAWPWLPVPAASSCSCTTSISTSRRRRRSRRSGGCAAS